MITHKTFIPVLCLLAGISLLSGRVDAQISEAEKLFEAGIYQQEAAGNFNEAIVLFNRLVNEYPKERTLAAKALLRLGICYERQGSQKATEAYQQIISQYPDQVSLANQARNRLAALGNEEPAGLTMARLYPPELYLECQTLSPDGTKLAYIDFDIGQNLAIYDIDGGKQKLLTNYDYNKKSFYTYAPVWSPDNTEIVYHAGSLEDQEDSFENLSITTLEGKTHVLFKNIEKGGVAPCDYLPDKSAVIAAAGDKDGLYKLISISTTDGTKVDLCQLKRKFANTDVSIAQASRISDVSPDGHLIVFSDSDSPDNGHRDIYIIPAKGGSKKVLIQHPADEREPRWSPDGRHIVFLSNRHGSWALWGVAVRDGQTDGLPFMILEGMQDTELASWTQNGLCSRTMAVINDIYLINIDPKTNTLIGKPQIIGDQEYGKSSFPQLSPDGKYLAYLSTLGSSPEPYIMIKPMGSGTIKKIKYDLPYRGAAASYRWLPDGSGMGFVFYDKEKNLNFSRLNTETGEWDTRNIPAGNYKGDQMNLAWVSDGKAFFYTRWGEELKESGIVRHDLETGQESYILQNVRGDSLSYQFWNLKASPDFRKLALKWGKEISVLDINTRKIDQMNFGQKNLFSSPVWSPDGKYLLVKGPPNEGSEINEFFIISLADRKITSLNISQYLPKSARIMSSHDWSPDGKTIVFDTRSWKSEANLIRNLIPEK